MANKYFSEFSDRKITAPMPPKDSRGGSNPPFPEKTKAWMKPEGSAGPKRNTVGWPEVKAYPAQKLADDKSSRVSKKISKLRHEGKEQDQAVAMALNMERHHRLTEKGEYKRARRKKY